jgi:hypothetical protein
MPLRIDFTEPINNDSLQLGDRLYYVNTRTGVCDINNDTNNTQALCEADSVNGVFGVWTPITGSVHSTDTPSFGGILTQISDNRRWVIIDDIGTQASSEIIADTFIMFAKDSSVNLSGLTGYYAEVEIRNNSKTNAEMFSIGSEITVSSK